MTDTDETCPRLLLVEDEEPIREGLAELFRSQGFEPDEVGDGLVALERLASATYDMVLLDWMLPGLDGLEVLRRMRARGVATPVLILTARGAEQDIVAGLEAGADDYVTKPFGIHELVARVKGLLKRRAVVATGAARIVRVGRAMLDLDRPAVTWAGGELALTAREADLLDYLVARRHRAVTREELLVDVWGYRDGSIQTRTVDVHIQQLRAKLRSAPDGERWIDTVRGRGYRFAAEPGG